MKVYVVTINEVSEFEQFDHEPTVFKDKKDAIAFLKRARKDAIAEYIEEDNGFSIDKDTDCYFALFNSAEGWSHTHYEVSVDECEVN